MTGSCTYLQYMLLLTNFPKRTPQVSMFFAVLVLACTMKSEGMLLGDKTVRSPYLFLERIRDLQKTNDNAVF